MPIEYRDFMVQWAGRRIHGHDRFIADGPIDWRQWTQSRSRLVFLMKEAYDNDLEDQWHDDDYKATDLGAHWTLPSLIRHLVFDRGWRPRTWQNLALWADALHRFKVGRVPVHEARELPSSVLASLRSSAVVNVKKYGGTSRSSDKNLAQHLTETSGDFTNIQLLAHQLRMLNPDWVVCCGTFNLVRAGFASNFGLNRPPEKRAWAASIHDGVAWFDYWHPAWPTSPYLLVNGLTALRTELEQSGEVGKTHGS